LAFAAAARAALFRDDFTGSGDLSSSWTLTLEDADDMTAQRASDQAEFFTDDGVVSSAKAYALTANKWSPNSATGLTWTTSFSHPGCTWSGGPDAWPFLFSSPAGNLKLYLGYDDATPAVLYVSASTLFGNADTTALRDSGNSACYLDNNDTDTVALTVQINSTQFRASMEATVDGTQKTFSTAWLNHGLAFDGTFASDAGYFGMGMKTGDNAYDAKVLYDYVELTPEPATVELMAAGLAAGLLRRRAKTGR
jgi:hypothetical protein